MSVPAGVAPTACANHPGVPATAGCGACGRPFCEACLVEFMGLRLCGACKEARLAHFSGSQPQASGPPTVADHIVPAKNPPALIAYYLGVFSLIPCAGNLLGPAAICTGISGLKAQRRNPNLPGKGHAIAGIILGSLTTLLYWGLMILFVVTVIGEKSRP